MSAYAFTALFNALAALMFGLWVYSTNPKQAVNRRWLLLNLAIAGWTFSQYMREMASSSSGAEFWGRYGVYLAASLIPVLYLHFIYDFAADVLPWRGRLLAASYGAAAVLMTLILSTDLVITGMVPNPFFRYYVNPGRLYPLFLVHFAGSFAAALGLMFIGIKRSPALRRDQLKIMVVALFITLVGGSTSFLPVLKINVFPFGNYFVSLYVFIYSYLVVKHRWMDINLFLRKSLAAMVVVLTLVIPMFILTVLGQNYFFGAVKPLFTLLVLAAMVLASLTFPRFSLKAEETIEQVLFPGRRDDRQTIARLSQEAVSILDLPKLLESLVATLHSKFQAGRVAVMVLDEKREQYRTLDSAGYGQDGQSPQLSSRSAWAEYFREHPSTLYREAAPEAEPGLPPGDVFEELGASLILPLVVKSRLVGIILMGPRDGGRPYSLDDFDILRTLANQVAIAIENARLYEDLKRSRQYIRRADRLASLGTLAAGLAHEIRNPLVSIKTFIQLLPQRLDDADFRTGFLSIANDEVERIRRLVEELLNFARPSEPNLQPTDINEIVEKTLLLVENDLRSKDIRLVSQLARPLPEILVDKEQIKQVILNVLLNAIQALGTRGQMKVETRTVGVDGDKPSVQVEVSDNGPGIAEEDLEHIFNPFFTTKQMGSGLGLAISHQIIKEHHGSIDVESAPGRGTGFFIKLPMDPRRHERRRTDSEQ